MGLATLIMSPFWIVPRLPDKILHLGQEEPKEMSRFLPSAEFVMLGMATSAIVFLGFKIYAMTKSLRADGKSTAATLTGDAGSLTGSRRTDIKLAWGLMGVSSVFALGLVVAQISRRVARAGAASSGSLGNMLPGLVGSYVLYQLLKKNQFSLYNVLVEIVSTLKTLEKRSRQPVRTLFAPGSHSTTRQGR